MNSVQLKTLNIKTAASRATKFTTAGLGKAIDRIPVEVM
jgi:hypothetical protein